MAIVDDIQAVDIEEQAKVNSDRAANSIRFRPESAMMTKTRYFKLMENMAKRDEAMQQLKEAVQKDVEENTDYNAVIGRNFPYGIKIVKLEDTISILKFEQPPMMLIGNRAIKLIDSMYNEVKKCTDEVYKAQIEEESKTETIETTPSIDVQKIADENGNVIGQTVETAISEEKSLDNNEINESIKVEIPSFTDVTVDATKEQIINQKVVDLMNSENSLNNVAPVVVEPVSPELGPVVDNPTVVEPTVAAPTNVVEPVAVEAVSPELGPIVNNPAPVAVAPTNVVESVSPELGPIERPIAVAPVVEPVVTSIEAPVTPVVENTDMVSPVETASAMTEVSTVPMNVESFTTEPVMVESDVVEDNTASESVEDEITKTRENEQYDKYQSLNEEAVKAEEEVAKVNEAKGFEFNDIAEDITEQPENEPVVIEETVVPAEPEIEDTQIRDEIITVPDRPEVDFEKDIEKAIEEEVDKEIGKDAKVVTGAGIVKLSEIDADLDLDKLYETHEKQLQEESDRAKKLEEDRERIDSELENNRELNLKITEEKEAAEKDVEKSADDYSKARQEYEDLVKSAIETAKNRNASLENSNQIKQEESISLSEMNETMKKSIDLLHQKAEANYEKADAFKEKISMINDMMNDRNKTQDEGELVIVK